jgi:hypothetical protein
MFCSSWRRFRGQKHNADMVSRIIGVADITDLIVWLGISLRLLLMVGLSGHFLDENMRNAELILQLV